MSKLFEGFDKKRLLRIYHKLYLTFLALSIVYAILGIISIFNTRNPSELLLPLIPVVFIYILNKWLTWLFE